MSNSPNLSLPYLSPAQAQKHVTHNEALRALDAVVQLAILDRDLSTPPSSANDGERFIVGAGATGDWAGQEDKVAAFQDGTWLFYAPVEGWLAWVADENALLAWDGTSWISAGGSINPAGLVGVNATADATNKLSVSSSASLFSHEGSDHRVKVNKAADTDTASVLFQTGFSGRAEFGLTGDDDFHMKVSSDGSVWKDAIILSRSTGEIGAPFTALGRANLLINGDFQINQRAFAGGALSSGVYGHDRWKAGAGGANYSISGYVMSLVSGSLEQSVEAALWGHSNFDNVFVTVSAKNPSADLSVAFGSGTGTISGGSGRQSYTFSPGTGTSATPSFEISAASAGTVTFSHLQIEVSSSASAWSPRSAVQEQMLCARYFQRITKVNGGSDVMIYASGPVSSGNFVGPVSLLGPMRAAPSLSYSALSDFAIVIPGSLSAAPTAIALSDDDSDALFGPRAFTLSCTYSGTSSGAGYLGVAASSTAVLIFDAEL